MSIFSDLSIRRQYPNYGGVSLLKHGLCRLLVLAFARTYGGGSQYRPALPSLRTLRASRFALTI